MTRNFDIIVIGAGGMGSATAFELARRGQSVLVLEQFNLVHPFGSSHGHTRIIRKAYYEHPDYVPLLHRAYDRWHDLEQYTERHLLTTTPCLSLGVMDSELIRGVLASASKHRLDVDYLDNAALRQKYPQFRVPENYVGLCEKDAGFLYVENCVQAHLDAAIELGAVVQSEEPVLGWTSNGNSVEVTTGQGTYFASRLVITAGPWLANMIPELSYPFTLMRQVLFWLTPSAPEEYPNYRRDRFPIFISDTSNGSFYGLPMIDRRGIKIGMHYGANEVGDPSEIDGNVNEADETQIREILNTYLPGIDGEVNDASTCIYTLTPDRHFVLDLHPEFSNVCIAGGFSGHGFKFASVVGEIMADFALTGKTALPVQMFNIQRLLTGSPS